MSLASLGLGVLKTKFHRPQILSKIVKLRDQNLNEAKFTVFKERQTLTYEFNK